MTLLWEPLCSWRGVADALLSSVHLLGAGLTDFGHSSQFSCLGTSVLLFVRHFLDESKLRADLGFIIR